MSDLVLDVKDLKIVYKTDLETVNAVNGIFTLQKGDLQIGRDRR